MESRWNDTGRATNQHATPRGDNPFQHLENCAAIEPMQRAADGHKVKHMVGGNVFHTTKTQVEMHTGLFRSRFRCLDHRSFRVEACTASHERSEADRQRTWATADIKQDLIAVQGKLFRDRAEECRSIGLSVTGIELDG
jgi:hypothetical protein